MYQLIIPAIVKKDIKKLPKDLQITLANKHLLLIQNNPYNGKFLKGKFRGFRKYSFSYDNSEYRVIYKIGEKSRFITLIIVASRENIYDRLERRV